MQCHRMPGNLQTSVLVLPSTDLLFFCHRQFIISSPKLPLTSRKTSGPSCLDSLSSQISPMIPSDLYPHSEMSRIGHRPQRTSRSHGAIRSGTRHNLVDSDRLENLPFHHHDGHGELILLLPRSQRSHPLSYPLLYLPRTSHLEAIRHTHTPPPLPTQCDPPPRCPRTCIR